MCAFSFPPQIVNEDILDSLESSELDYNNHLNAFKPSVYYVKKYLKYAKAYRSGLTFDMISPSDRARF